MTMTGFQAFSVREAVDADKPAIERMGLQFVSSVARYGTLFRATSASMHALSEMFLTGAFPAVILLAVDGKGVPFGMIACVVAPQLIDGTIYADEVVWWVDPDARGMRAGPALLKAAEEWARGKNCSMLKMVAPVPSTVGRFYERLGYVAVETAHVKVL